MTGVTAMLEALVTRTSGGASLAATPPYFSPDQPEEVASDRAFLKAVDDWLTPAQDRALHALTQLPMLQRVALLVAAGDVLDDVALFELKRFTYWGAELLHAAPFLPHHTSHAALRSLMAAIHPETTPSPRFTLVASHDPALADARAAVKAARREEQRVRRAVEADLTAQYGGRFDVEGHLHHDADAVLTDPRLVPMGERAYRVQTPELAAAALALDEAQSQCERQEHATRARLTALVAPSLPLLLEVRDALVALDFAIARVQLRRAWGGCWPSWATETALTDALHPSLLKHAASQRVSIAFDEPGIVLTGPNMGGKSTLVKLLGLAHWCAQHGFPVPAHSCAVRPVHRIVYVGPDLGAAGEDGLSAFGREVHRVVAHRDGEHPMLWLLDEFGRGTHPAEGAALALDFVRACVDADLVVAATHFPTLAAARFLGQFQIAGLRHDEARAAVARDLTPSQLHDALRAAMDYRPLRRDPDDHEIPRDARLVAAMLGLDLDLPEY